MANNADGIVRIPVTLVVELTLPVGYVTVPDFVTKFLCDEINHLITNDTMLERTFSEKFGMPVMDIALEHVTGYPIK